MADSLGVGALDDLIGLDDDERSDKDERSRRGIAFVARKFVGFGVSIAEAALEATLLRATLLRFREVRCTGGSVSVNRR